MNPASNLILIGPMGAGKTSVGRRVARATGLDFVDVDQLLEQRTGASVNLIFELEGEAGFRRRESELLAEICADDDQLIATGGGAVLDADNRSLLKRSGFVIFLDLSVDQQLMRLSRDRTRPLLQAPDRRKRLLAMAEQRRPLYLEVADLVLDSNGLSAPRASQRLLALLDGRWQREEAGHAA
ncbi:MAG: shikimate kinase [Rhodanobacteraceae bacterium]|nr:shikimate kinase [Xanthomonadales bacterium]MCP5479368.1 shikimate kinase [Rhodanobacteraceae bacterium]HPF72629.1 shikimate kinase [Xanthomonadaceae bacterium]HRY00056.1 shikimate kinase [Xanthomonadaceae bacterium]